jgi:hypothetical protein
VLFRSPRSKIFTRIVPSWSRVRMLALIRGKGTNSEHFLPRRLLWISSN